MANVQAYTSSGTKSSSKVTLDKTVFGVVINNHDLIKAAYEAYLANGRANLAKSKSRGEVRGGGRKPWRQKGTGRARFGSSRNPIWRGGGIAFGPTGEENFSKKINVSAKRQAIRQSLSLAANGGKLIVVDGFKPKDNKTSSAASFLKKIGAERATLIVVSEKTPALNRAVKNLPNVKLVSAKYINVFDAINAWHIIIEKSALATISEWLGGKK